MMMERKAVRYTLTGGSEAALNYVHYSRVDHRLYVHTEYVVDSHLLFNLHYSVHSVDIKQIMIRSKSDSQHFVAVACIKR